MNINLLFFIIFFASGFILLLLALVLNYKDNRFSKNCSEAVKGNVIKYTLWSNNGVSFPIVDYLVNNVSYTQRLKYGYIITTSSSFKNVNSEINSNVEDANLRINKDAISLLTR